MTNIGRCSLVAIAFIALLAGCVENNSRANNGVTSPAQAPGFEPGEPMGKEQTASDAGVVELPMTTIAPAIADLAARIGVVKSAIQVLHAIAVIWNDSSLGCPQPGQSYTQVLVHGFWVVLEHDGERYSYHAGNKGIFRLCTNAPRGPLVMPPGGRRDTDV